MRRPVRALPRMYFPSSFLNRSPLSFFISFSFVGRKGDRGALVGLVRSIWDRRIYEKGPPPLFWQRDTK